MVNGFGKKVATYFTLLTFAAVGTAGAAEYAKSKAEEELKDQKKIIDTRPVNIQYPIVGDPDQESIDSTLVNFSLDKKTRALYENMKQNWGDIFNLSERSNRGVGENYESSGKKIKTSFKLSLGSGNLLDGAGDLSRVNKSSEERGAVISDLGADFIINITPTIGIGLGSGFIIMSSKKKISTTIKYPESWVTTEEKSSVAEKYKITAIPLNFNLYIFRPVGKSNKYTFFGYAGVGYYLGKLTHVKEENSFSNYESSDSSSKGEYNDNETLNEKAKCNSMGFHGGLGLEMKLSSAVSLGAEVFGRYVNFKNWEGEASTSWKSKHRYWDSQSGWNEETSSGGEGRHGFLWTIYMDRGSFNKEVYMLFWKEKPSSTLIKKVRKSSINLNTVGFRLSVKVRF